MINRRKSIELMAGVGGTLCIPSILVTNSTNKGWLSEFAERWDISALYTNEVLAKMPDEDFLYQPAPEVMSFGKQLSHLGWGNAIYTGAIIGEDPIKEPAELRRQSVQAYLDLTSKGIKNLIMSIDEKLLFTNNHGSKGRAPWNDFTVSDLLLIAYHHTAHHRAQAIVYLRMKGIVPPKYRF